METKPFKYWEKLRAMIEVKTRFYTALKESGVVVDDIHYQSRITIYENISREAFVILEEAGYWDYYTSNKTRRMTGMSQVVKFFQRKTGGWLELAKGFTIDGKITEVHHCDHNPGNNDEENLEYVTPELNNFLFFLVNQTKLVALRLAEKSLKGENLRIAKKTIIMTNIAVSSNKSEMRPVILSEKKVTQEMADHDDGFFWIGKNEYLKTQNGVFIMQFTKCLDRIQHYCRGFSAKEMLKNIKKFGFTHKYYTPGYTAG